MNQRYTSDTQLVPLFSKIFGTPPPLQMTQFLEGPTSFPPPPSFNKGVGMVVPTTFIQNNSQLAV